jgi:glycosyltransferase involved in cell wall biosynthesis
MQMDSLLAQDWENLEVVVVDDGSTDGTRELLLDYADRDSRVAVHFNEQNLGFLGNFQKAFALTRGAFIAPSDQDDWWDPAKLRGLHAAIGDRALAYCDSLLIDDEGRSLGRRVSEVVPMYGGEDPAAFVFGNSVSGHAMLIRRDLVERAMPFPVAHFHDWWLAFVAVSTEGLVYVPEPWVHYRQHGAAQTDLSGREKAQRRQPHRWVELNHRRDWIAALAQLPSVHQAYFQDLLGAWDEWTRSWFCPRLVALVLARRDSLFATNHRAYAQRTRRSFRYLWGLKLKRLLAPWRYNPRG